MIALSRAGALLFVATTAVAQTPTTPKIPIRQLPAPTATSTDSIGSIAAVRQLPNGNVLLNDQARRRVVLLDANMKVIGLVADSTSTTNNAYGARPGGMISYRGDSTLFIDPAGLSMLVIDPAGKIIRTMAAPRANDVNFLIGGASGNPGFDTNGRLVYRTVDFGFGRGRGAGPQPGQPFVPPTPPDSSALVRFDLATRKLDTVGFFKIPKSNISMTQDANGRMSVSITMNPLPVVDDWAVMSDGTVAFVRGRDYHVDFFGAGGVKTSSEKIPYEWQRMDDDDKSRFLDSAKASIERTRAAVAAGGPGATQALQQGMESMGLGGGGAPTMIFMGGPGGPGGAAPPQRGGGDGAGRGGDGGRGGAPGGGFQVPPINMVPISELPDYKPVFASGSVRADMDGRLWVRTIPTKPTPGGAIYDVIDEEGKLVDRVQVPAGTTIAGFGKGGIVYLGVRDASGIHVQRIVSK
ncbi:hypothetical protein BH09GEM1_BH09GEM1_44580 [soil metagenome]